MKELPENWCVRGVNKAIGSLFYSNNPLAEKIEKKFPGINKGLGFYHEYYYYSNGNELIPSDYLPTNKTEISFEDFERYVLSDVKLKCGNKVEFDLGSEVLNYTVGDTYLNNREGANNSILKKLGFTEIGADKFCRQYLGDSMMNGNDFAGASIATYSSGDYEAANRLVDALQAECKKFRDVAKFGWTGRAAPDWSSGTPSTSNGLQIIDVGASDYWSTLQDGIDSQKIWANCGNTVLKWSDLANAIEDKYITVNKGKDKLRNFKF